MSANPSITGHWYVKGRISNNPPILKKKSCEPYSNYHSRNLRVAHTINASPGGRIQFGNYKEGTLLNLNYLGRLEGMPGGGGTPFKNRF